MAAATRILRISRPLGLPCYSSSKNCNFSPMVSTRSVKARCLGSSGGLSTENWPSARPPTERAPKEVKVSVSTSGCVITSRPKTDIWVDLAQFLADVADFVGLLLRRLTIFIRRTPWKLHMQMFMEKVFQTYFYSFILALVFDNVSVYDIVVGNGNFYFIKYL